MLIIHDGHYGIHFYKETSRKLGLNAWPALPALRAGRADQSHVLKRIDNQTVLLL